MSDNHDLTAVLDAVRSKLACGGELLVEDLQSLKAFHRCHEDDFANPVPYLNRTLLHQGVASTDTGRFPQLVRYIGMVQDMMDPEYYACKDSKGRSTHFRDAVIVDEEEDVGQNSPDMHRHDLAERIPLVVVPLPYTSEWFFRGLYPESMDTSRNDAANTPSPKSVAHPFDERKRARNDGNEEQDHSNENNKRERKDDVMDEAMDGAGEDVDATVRPTHETQPIDWWPAGTCGSFEKECPVLAKLCYDQLQFPSPNEARDDSSSPPRHRLMLNDIVSMIGVLSVNPWEADFSKQQQGSPSENNNEWMDNGAGWGDDFVPTLPPPSLMPRLHVLSYERLGLEELAERAMQNLKTAQEQEESMDVTGVTTNTLSCPDAFLSLFDTQANPKETQLLAQALWMCLLSKADRRSSSNKGSDEHLEMLRAGPMEQALGCLSLQLSMPDLDRSRSLFQLLATNVLPAICPIVATIDFTKRQDIVQLGVGPGKDASGRLRPCPLQLPAGSVLLVHYHPQSSLAKEMGSLAAIKAALHELVQQHRLPYRFEGDVILPFEADYRVIVVTTQTNQLPCTLSLLNKDRIAASSTNIREDAYTMLREMLCLARYHMNSTTSKLDIKLSASLMERAQEDFMSRRRDAYESKQQKQASGHSCSTPLPGEDDFHRWLTMTKIQAKHRLSWEANDAMEATVEDWEIALKLDDASQQALVSGPYT
jgi:hypothetical protein